MSYSLRRPLAIRPEDKVAAPPPMGALRLLEAEASTGGRREATRSALYTGQYVAPILLRVTTIGRGLQNSVVLLDPSVSREHACLASTEEGWSVENLSRHNPLWAGERELPPGAHTFLLPGEVLRLGHTALQLIAPSAGAGGSAALGDAPPGSHEDADVEETLPAHAFAAPGSTGEASSTRLFSPGVTLQFALQGKFSPGMRWLLGLAVLALFLLSGIITLGTAALVGHDALSAGGIGHMLAALTIPLIPVVGVALVVLALDAYEREPLVMLLAAFLWGAVIAIPPTLFIEHRLVAALLRAFQQPGIGGGLLHALAQAIGAGVPEELIKGAGLLLLLYFLRDEFDNVTDGVLYGVVIGAGFAMVENFVYFALTPRADLGFLIFGRVALGWLSHSTFTALFGAGLGYARETHNRRWHKLLPLLGLLAAILLHTYFDFVAFSADTIVGMRLIGRTDTLLALTTLAAEYVPLFLTQALLLRIVLRALRREAAIVREYLVPEVLAGAVTPDEYILLQHAPLRAAAEHRYALTYGVRAYITARTLYQTATGLAFRSWHVAMGDPPKRAARQPEDAYRARIAKLRRSLLRQIAQAHTTLAGNQRGRVAAPTTPLRK